MNKEEFKKFVLEEAKKLLATETKKTTKTTKTVIPTPSVKKEVKAKVVEESVTADQIEKMVTEMKAINKSLDFRKPVISESVNSIIAEAKKSEPKILPVKDDSAFKGYKDKWKNLLDYKIPGDESRNKF